MPNTIGAGLIATTTLASQGSPSAATDAGAECADSLVVAAAVADSLLDGIVFEVLVLPSGQVDPCSIRVVSTPHRAFVAPAARSVREVVFSAPRRQRQPVAAWVQTAIGFRVPET